MTERTHREGYAVHLVKAREQLVHAYHKLSSIRATARMWRTARPVARDQAEGTAGLQDRSRRPHTAPRRTSAEWEQLVVPAHQTTGLGRRLALYVPSRRGRAVQAAYSCARLGLHISFLFFAHRVPLWHPLTEKMKILALKYSRLTCPLAMRMAFSGE
ncbi:MAG: hypothetical protein DDG58_08810 [Ardenticatenia bacterium]|jgi:hypothetical protein|nr:MAG: hypothetical protein DDG58_08810 [Ardenticatenia bacterium]